MGGKGKGGKGGAGAPPPPPKLSVAEKEAQKEEMARKAREMNNARKAKIAQQKQVEEMRRELAPRLPSCKAHAIEEVPWPSAQLSLHLVGGKGGEMQGGVRAFQLEGDEIVLLRLQGFTSESVALSVANCLGIHVAQFRLVHPTDAEWAAIEEAYRRVDPWYNDLWEEMESHVRNADDERMTAWKRFQETYQETRSVLEFVPGLSLDKAFWIPGEGFCWTPTPLAESLLLSLGRLCAFDVLLNNYDRLPMPLWENEWGNCSNAMVVDEKRGLIGIDQQVNIISDETAVDNYLSKVREMTNRLVRKDYAHTSLQALSTKMKKGLHTVCGVSLSDSSMVALYRGMCEGLLKVSERHQSGALRQALAGAVEASASIKERTVPAGAQECADFILLVAEEVSQAVRARRASLEQQQGQASATNGHS